MLKRYFDRFFVLLFKVTCKINILDIDKRDQLRAKRNVSLSWVHLFWYDGTTQGHTKTKEKKGKKKIFDTWDSRAKMFEARRQYGTEKSHQTNQKTYTQKIKKRKTEEDV